MKKIFLILGVVFFALTLIGCIEVEMKTQFTTNESGSFTISYTMQKSFFEMGALEQDDASEALPMEEEEFRAAVDIEGLEFKSFETHEEDDLITVIASFDFSSISALNAYHKSQSEFGQEISLDSTGDIYMYSQILLPAADQGEDAPSSEDLEMMKTFFQGFELRYLLSTPKNIQKANIGEIDGKNVSLSIGFEEMIGLEKDLVWNVSWSK
jgi:hypothetical protein